MSGVMVWLAVGVVGGLGAVARFAVDGAVSARNRTALPLGTLTVNVAGAFLLGLLVGAGAGGDTRLVLGGAFLGSFTTFSTWMFETHRLGEDRGPTPALANVALSIALGLSAAGAGWALGAAIA